MQLPCGACCASRLCADLAVIHTFLLPAGSVLAPQGLAGLPIHTFLLPADPVLAPQDSGHAPGRALRAPFAQAAPDPHQQADLAPVIMKGVWQRDASQKTLRGRVR